MINENDGYVFFYFRETFIYTTEKNLRRTKKFIVPQIYGTRANNKQSYHGWLYFWFHSETNHDEFFGGHLPTVKYIETY